MESVKSLNLNHIRVFVEVFKAGNMTHAAHILHITQSGVSQHMANLEEEVKQKLFDRVGRSIVPTNAGKKFYESCLKFLSQLDTALLEMQGERVQISGNISIGMPIEYGNSKIIPLLTQFAKLHSQTRYSLNMDFASNINQLLLKGTLDFAFVDDFEMDPSITKEVIGDEILELCISNSLLPKSHTKHDRKFFESLSYVDYQPKAPVLYGWFHHHLGSRTPQLNVRATVMDVQAVARLVAGSVGAGVIPDYAADELERRGVKIHRFRGSGKAFHNRISLAYLKDRSHSFSVRKCMEYLRQNLSNPT
jgi:DNA-binding transcriptional LysR family regulator